MDSDIQVVFVPDSGSARRTIDESTYEAISKFQELLQQRISSKGMKSSALQAEGLFKAEDIAVDQFNSADLACVDLSIAVYRATLVYQHAVRQCFGHNSDFVCMYSATKEEAISLREVFNIANLVFYTLDADRNVKHLDDGGDLVEIIDRWIRKARAFVYDKITDKYIDQVKALTRESQNTGKRHKKLSERLWQDVCRPTLERSPNLVSEELLYNILLAFREMQDYDSMVKVDALVNQNKKLALVAGQSKGIQYLVAFAHSRLGTQTGRLKALLILENLLQQQKPCHDAICLCGRIYKDMFVEYGDKTYRNMAIDWYRQSFLLQPNIHAGINLMTLLVTCGRGRDCQELKKIIVTLCVMLGQQGDVRTDKNYWNLASCFEFCVVTQHYDRACLIAFLMYKLDPPSWCIRSTLANVSIFREYLNSLILSGEYLANDQSEKVLNFWLDFLKSSAEGSDSPNCAEESFPVVMDTSSRRFQMSEATNEPGSKTESLVYASFYELYMNVSGVEDDDSHLVFDCIRCEEKNSMIVPCRMILSVVRGQDARALFLYFIGEMDHYKLCFASVKHCTRFYNLVNDLQKISIEPRILTCRNDSNLKIRFKYVVDKHGNRVQLGQGTYGRVLLARDMDNPLVNYAVKIIPLREPKLLETLQNEIRILSVLRHRNIVRYYGSLVEQDGNQTNFKIILEYVEGGSLAHVLKKFGPFSENLIRSYLSQILKGVEYLHSNQIMHRDIKGNNILVNRFNGEVKITDFGTCTRLVGLNRCVEDCIGTVQYMAPDVIRVSEKGYGLAADIWSIGCTVIEMVTGKPPYPDEKNSYNLYLRIGNLNTRPEIPDHLSDCLKDLINQCFQADPESRATAKELLMHPFFDQCSDLSVLRPRTKCYLTTFSASCSNLARPRTISPLPPVPPLNHSMSTCSTANEECMSSNVAAHLLDVVRKRKDTCLQLYRRRAEDSDVPCKMDLASHLLRLVEDILCIRTAKRSSLQEIESNKHELARCAECLVNSLKEVALVEQCCETQANVLAAMDRFMGPLVRLILFASGETVQSANDVSVYLPFESTHESRQAFDALRKENEELLDELIKTQQRYSIFLQSYIDLMKRKDEAVRLLKEFK